MDSGRTELFTTASPSRSSASPEELFRTQYASLCRVLTVFCGNEEMAADAAQEAFVQAWLHWARVRSLERPEAWLRRVAVNRLLNRRRSLARRARALLRLQPREEEADPDRRLDLTAALQALPSQQRLATVLRYVGDLTLPEIAEVMGVSEGTVSQHLARGRSRLRTLLEGHHE